MADPSPSESEDSIAKPRPAPRPRPASRPSRKPLETTQSPSLEKKSAPVIGAVKLPTTTAAASPPPRRPRPSPPQKSPPALARDRVEKQRPSPLSIPKVGVCESNSIQYPGYTPTTPPNLDLTGGRLVRFAGGFEVITTYGTSEYERKNPDHDPVLASAACALEKMVEEMETFEVELQKEGASGLGMSVTGKSMIHDPDMASALVNIYVRDVKEGGVAFKDGRIAAGDCLTEVDGQSLVGVSSQLALSLLGAAGDRVKLTVARRSSAVPAGAASDLQKLKVENAELLEKVSGFYSLQEEFKRLQAVTKDLEEKLQAETSACASLRDELSTQVESSKAEKNERDCAISDLEQRVVELEKERVQLTERLGNLDSQQDESELAAAKSLVEQLEAEVEGLRGQKTDDKIEECQMLQEQVLQLSESLQLAQTQNDELHKHIKDLEEFIDEREAEWERASEKLAQSDAVLEAEQLLRRVAERDLDEMKEKLADRKIAPKHMRRPTRKQNQHPLVSVPRAPLLDVTATKERVRLAQQSTRRRRPSRGMIQRNATSPPPPPPVEEEPASITIPPPPKESPPLSPTGDSPRPRQRSLTTVPKPAPPPPKAMPPPPPRKSSLQSPEGSFDDTAMLHSPPASASTHVRRSMTMSVAESPFAKKLGDLFGKGGSIPMKPSAIRLAATSVESPGDDGGEAASPDAPGLQSSVNDGTVFGDENADDSTANALLTRSLSSSVSSLPPPPSALLEGGEELDSDEMTEKLSGGGGGTPSPPCPPTGEDAAPMDESTEEAAQHRRQSRWVTEWNRGEVNEWLSVIKMDRYAESFQEQGVVGSHLPELDDSKLKALGVKSGDRSTFKKEAKAMRIQLEKMRKQQKKRLQEEMKLAKKKEKEALRLTKKGKKHSRTSSED